MSTQTPQTITERIYANADNRLRSDIQAAMLPLRELMKRNCSDMEGTLVLLRNLEALEQPLFEVSQAEYRQREMDTALRNIYAAVNDAKPAS